MGYQRGYQLRRRGHRMIVAVLITGGAGLHASCRGGDHTEYLSPDDDHWAYFGLTDAEIRSVYSQESWQDTGPLLELARRHVPYDSLQLTRHGCGGGECPAYRVTLRKSGSATFEGEWMVPLEGLWNGKLDIGDFAQICYAFELVPPPRSERITGMRPEGGFTLVFWPSDGGPASVRSGYFGDGPTSAWVLRGAIDGLVLRIPWLRASPVEGDQ